MVMNLSDAVVVITGASSGIARATALEVAKHKGSVVLASRQEEPLNEVKAECEQMGARALVVPTDTSDEQQVRELASKAIEAFGKIDAWINAAAVSLLARFEDAPPEEFRKVIDTNFFGYVNGARAVLPHFRQRKRGVLLNVSSVVGKVGAPYASAYVASKFAVTGLTESLRMEYLGMPDIHICAVFPASTDTPLFQHAANYTGRAVQAMPPVYTPESVAREIVGCIQKPQREVFLGNTGRMVAMHSASPGIAERLIAKKVDRQHFQDQPAEATQGNVFRPMTGGRVHGGWGGREEVSPKPMVAGVVALALGVAGWILLSKRAERRKPLLQKAMRKVGLRARNGRWKLADAWL